MDPPTAPARQRKSRRAAQNDAQRTIVRTKIVVRRLPALMKEIEFREVVKEHVNDATIDYFSWEQGKVPEELVAAVYSNSRLSHANSRSPVETRLNGHHDAT